MVLIQQFTKLPVFRQLTNKELKKVGYQIGAKFPEDTKVISCTLLNTFKEIFGENWKEKLDWQNAFENKIKSSNCFTTFRAA